MNNYPEHEKLRARESDHETIIDFLDWLTADGLVIARWEECPTGRAGGDYREEATTDRGKGDLIARYFGIDSAKFSAEKDAMLAAYRRGEGQR